jgi:hypothetical protein
MDQQVANPYRLLLIRVFLEAHVTKKDTIKQMAIDSPGSYSDWRSVVYATTQDAVVV